MSSGANHVSLLFTGSIRNALADDARGLRATHLRRGRKHGAADDRAASTSSSTSSSSSGHRPPRRRAGARVPLNATRSHPRSTQQLAWECWSATPAGKPVTLETVIRAHDRLVQTIERSEFASVLHVLLNGDEGEVNEVRALQLLADRGGDKVTSRPLAPLLRLLQPLPRPARTRPPAAPRPRRPARRQLVHRRPALQRVAAPRVAARRPAGARDRVSACCTTYSVHICTV